MRNLGKCISAVLASALRNPDRSPQLQFKLALECVASLVDFSLMAQYRSHTEETLQYMDNYLRTFHRKKHIFIEFRTSKSTRTAADKNDKALRNAQNERLIGTKGVTAAQRRRLADEDRLERAGQRMEFLQRENHFNFIKMHYLTHFVSHVSQFGNIPMDSTDVSQVAHKDQIKV